MKNRKTSSGKIILLITKDVLGKGGIFALIDLLIMVVDLCFLPKLGDLGIVLVVLSSFVPSKTVDEQSN